MYLVVERISLKEMRALQCACMLVSMKAREKEERNVRRMAAICYGKRKKAQPRDQGVSQ